MTPEKTSFQPMRTIDQRVRWAPSRDAQSDASTAFAGVLEESVGRSERSGGAVPNGQLALNGTARNLERDVKRGTNEAGEEVARDRAGLAGGSRFEGLETAVEAELLGKETVTDLASRELQTGTLKGDGSSWEGGPASGLSEVANRAGVPRAEASASTGATPEERAISAKSKAGSDTERKGGGKSREAEETAESSKATEAEQGEAERGERTASIGRSGAGAGSAAGAFASVGPGGVGTGSGKVAAASPKESAGAAVTGLAAHGEAGVSKPGGAGVSRWLDRVSGSTGRPVLTAEPSPAAVQAGRAVAQAVRDGEGNVTLRLTPEALGRVTIHLRLEEGVVSATIECATAAGHEAFEGGTESLRASLEARGLQVGALELAPMPLPRESNGNGRDVGDGAFDDGHTGANEGEERPGDGEGGGDGGGRQQGDGDDDGGSAGAEPRGLRFDPVSMRLEAWA